MESNQYNQNYPSIKSFLKLVDLILKKNQKEFYVILELKTCLKNFTLSFKDKGYTKAIVSNDKLNQIINSIIDSLDSIIKNMIEKFSKIKFLIRKKRDMNLIIFKIKHVLNPYKLSIENSRELRNCKKLIN